MIWNKFSKDFWEFLDSRMKICFELSYRVLMSSMIIVLVETWFLYILNASEATKFLIVIGTFCVGITALIVFIGSILIGVYCTMCSNKYY